MSAPNSSDSKKKKGFFADLTKAIDDVVGEVKADIAAMTPPSKDAEKKAAAQAQRDARVAGLVGEATQGMMEEIIDDAPELEPEAPEAPEPAEDDANKEADGTSAFGSTAPKVLTMPTGNLWQALADPATTTRLHGDACYHALGIEDIDHYTKAVQHEKLVPFTLGLIGINIAAGLEDEGEDVVQPDDLLFNALQKALADPRIYGMVGAGSRQLWPKPEMLDEHLTALLNANPKLVALGPLGIDEPFAPYLVQQQEDQLALQLDIAADFDLPVFLTHRNSLGRIAETLAECERLPQLVWMDVLKGEDDLALVRKFNMHVMLRPEVTQPDFAGLAHYRQVAQEKILLGSGSALVAPHGFQGHFNQPKFLQNTLSAAARGLFLHDNELLYQTNTNLSKLFLK